MTLKISEHKGDFNAYLIVDYNFPFLITAVAFDMKPNGDQLVENELFKFKNSFENLKFLFGVYRIEGRLGSS